MRPWLLVALVLVSLTIVVASRAAATRPGAIVASKSGALHVLDGAHCVSDRLSFGVWPFTKPGKKMGIIIGNPGMRPGRTEISDGFMDLRPRGVNVALSGTASVDRDRKSGRFDVWGRDSNGATGHRWTGTWRCP